MYFFHLKKKKKKQFFTNLGVTILYCHEEKQMDQDVDLDIKSVRVQVENQNINSLQSTDLTFYLCFSQVYMDPFEEIGMAEKNAEQHRRSATEKEVRPLID